MIGVDAVKPGQVTDHAILALEDRGLEFADAFVHLWGQAHEGYDDRVLAALDALSCARERLRELAAAA